MDWVERRARIQNGIPEYWNVLRNELDQALSSFRSQYGSKRKASAAAQRIGDCFHVTYETTGQHVERSIDICLDLEGWRVYSRTPDGAQLAELRFECHEYEDDCSLTLVNEAGEPVSNDQASELFLEQFLFPESKTR